ncbi:MAG: hypothetical protein AVDCRST_MAG79-1476, partial [uncultured Thermoleophilia bacterium]
VDGRGSAASTRGDRCGAGRGGGRAGGPPR